MTLPRDAGLVALVTVGVGALAALLVLMLDAQAPLRGWLALHPEHPVQGIEASTIWLINARGFGTILAMSLAARFMHDQIVRGLSRSFMSLLDGFVSLVVFPNVVLIGLATGAGGWLVLSHEPLHYVCELVALSVASACYLAARRGRLPWLVFAGCSVLVGALLWVGALLEAT